MKTTSNGLKKKRFQKMIEGILLLTNKNVWGMTTERIEGNQKTSLC